MAPVRKYSINQLNTLIESIKTDTGLTEEEIAGRVGYNEGYISQTRTRGEVSNKFMESLKREFPAGQNANRGTLPKQAPPNNTETHAPDYRDDMIAYLKEKISLNEQKLLVMVQRNQALLKAITETLPILVSRMEKVKVSEATEEMGKRIEHHLDALKKENI